MKVKIIFSALSILLYFGCASEKNNDDDVLVGISRGIELVLPAGYQFRLLQGIDSRVGEIIDTNDDSFYMYIDIRLLAGSYVNPSDNNVLSGRSINEDYIFQKRESQFLSNDNCCYFFTFPDLGPANFIVPDNDKLDEAIAIIESVASTI